MGDTSYKMDMMTHGDTKGATMTSTEVMEKLFSHDLMDEIEVSNKYLDYAVALDNEGKDCVAKKIAEMGYEEFTHAHVQRDILMDAGYTLPYETSVAFEQLKHRVHTLFRE